jgi:hypothetical protein
MTNTGASKHLEAILKWVSESTAPSETKRRAVNEYFKNSKEEIEASGAASILNSLNAFAFPFR